MPDTHRNAQPQLLPPTPAIVSGILVAALGGVVVGGLAWTDALPKVALTVVHPLALAGHVLAAGAMTALLLDLRHYGAVREDVAHFTSNGQCDWSLTFRERSIGDLLKRRSTPEQRIAAARENCQRFQHALDQRWLKYYWVPIFALPLPGLLVGLRTLVASETLPLSYGELFAPLTLGTLEALGLGGLATYLRLSWSQTLEDWLDHVRQGIEFINRSDNVEVNEGQENSNGAANDVRHKVANTASLPEDPPTENKPSAESETEAASPRIDWWNKNFPEDDQAG